MKRIFIVGAVLLALFMAQNVFAERHIKMDDQGGWASLDKKDTIVPDEAGGWYINGRHFIPDGPEGWKSDDGKISVKLDGEGGWWINNDHFVPDGEGGWKTDGDKTVKSDGENGLIINY